MSYLLILLLVPLGLACVSQLLKGADPLTRDEKWYGQPDQKKENSQERKRERELTYTR